MEHLLSLVRTFHLLNLNLKQASEEMSQDLDSSELIILDEDDNAVWSESEDAESVSSEISDVSEVDEVEI